MRFYINRSYLFILVLTVILLMVGCSREDKNTLTISGSSTMAPVVAELAENYEQRHPDIRIDVQSGGSSRGFQDVRQGLADLGMASRALTEDESDITVFTLANDGIGIILHADNPVDSLDREHVVAIYKGLLHDWLALDGAGKITVINKASGRATLDLFLDYFELNEADIDADLIAGENQQVIQTVARNTGAIGYVSIGTASFEIERGTPIKLLPIDGIPANYASMQAGAYPLSRPLNLLYIGADEKVADFLEYCRSDEAAGIISKHLFVPFK